MATSASTNKLRELVLYVSARLAGDPYNGTIKRNKVLAFADFAHYEQYGEPITGATYVKQTFGPAPKGIRQLEADMISDGLAAQVVVGFGPRTQKLLFPQREANLALFSGTEIACVEAALTLLDDKTGMESSSLSHSMMLGWKYGRDKDEIPYCTAFLYDGPVTSADRGKAAELADLLGGESANGRESVPA